MSTRSVASRAYVFLSNAIPFAIFLGIWQAATASKLIDPAFLPSVTSISAALADLAHSGSFFVDIAITMLRSLGGLVLGALIGIPIGAGMAISPAVNGFFNPLIKATYSLPKTALIPLLILWCGIGSTTNIIAVMLSTLLPLVVYTYHGVHGVSKTVIWSALAMGTSKRQLLWLILLPAAQQSVLTGLRIALGFSFVIAIAAEMIASTRGIGKLMFIYGENGTYDYMFAAVFTIVLGAYLADRALVILSNHLLRWDDIEQRLG